MKNIFVSSHPLTQHKLTMLRDKNTGAKEFRELVSEMSLLLGYEATRDLPLREVDVTTPVGVARSKVMKDAKIALVPVLRAGLQMVDGLINVMPNARIGHLGIYRDRETGESVEYYCKMPEDICERDVFILDPLIATGESTCMALDRVKQFNPRSVRLISIIASAKGVELVSKMHPEIEVYLADIDDELSKDGVIIPGVGDAGNRLFGTM